MAGRLEGRICLVTGASRGIGAAVAKAYALEGAQVVALARTQGGLEALADEIEDAGGIKPSLVLSDLSKLESIDQLGEALFQRFGRIDVLVSNAAQLGVLGPLAQSDPRKFEHTLQLNILSNYRLIRACDPLLRLSPAGRAIFVTSGVAQGVCPHWGAYALSKVALEYMVQLYVQENTSAALKAYLLDPGVVRTRMRAEAFPGENPQSLPAPDQVAARFIELAMADCPAPSGARIAA